MPAVAEHIINASGGYTIDFTRDNGVFSGHKHFRVTGAMDIQEVYTATGLPATGDAFAPAYPGVKARIFRPTLEPGSFGFWRVRVDYRQDTPQDITPVDGYEITTTLEQSRSSINVDRDWTNTKKLTNDKSGIPKIITALTFIVVQYHDTLPNYSDLMELSDSPKINSDAIVLQRFLGQEGANIPFAPKQLLYAGFTPSYENGLFVTRHELMARRSWENVRVLEDAAGEPTGTEEISDVYEPVAFAGKFGGA